MIITPQILFKEHIRSNGEFAEREVSRFETAEILEKEFYFSGEKTHDGVVRIFAKLYSPKKSASKAVVVFLDYLQDISAFDPTPFLHKGFSVFVIDYSGDTGQKPKFSFYPQSVSYANARFKISSATEFSKPEESFWFEWGKVGIAAVFFIKSLGFSDIFLFAIGHGGETAYKAALYHTDIKAIATILASGLSIEDINYRATLDSTSYVSILEMPILIKAATGEVGGGLDRAEEIFESAVNKNARLSIYFDSTVSAPQVASTAKFFENILKGEAYVASPKIEISANPASLVHTITIDNSKPIKSVDFFISYMQGAAEDKYWQKIPLKVLSESEYIAEIQAIALDKPIFSFVSVNYCNGTTISSAISKAFPAKLGVQKAIAVKRRLVYSSEDGVSGWGNKQGEKFGDIELATGPLGLEGVLSTNGILINYSLIDPLLSGEDGLSLQFTIYSPLVQDVKFIAFCSETEEQFEFVLNCDNLANWQKTTIEPTDFVSSKKYLKSFASVYKLMIISSSTLMVHSILWV